MATLVAQPAAPATTPAMAYDRLRLLASAPFLFGMLLAFLGFAWDIQWHSDVGPDTFFTVPHLVLYSGVAVAGITALIVVLQTTFRYRGVTDGVTAILGNRFRGPAGYIIGGIGATLFLAYGLLDQWWHSIYGFDVTLVSPPHVGLILSILITMIGGLCAFASEVRYREARGDSLVGPALGFAAAAAMLAAFITLSAVDVMAEVAAGLGLGRSPHGTFALLFSMTLLMAAATLRWPGAATLVALVFTGLRVALWDLIPWITGEYASAIGLFLRDYTDRVPVVPAMLPAYLLVAGIAVDLVLFAGRRLNLSVWLTVIVAGALTPLLIQLTEPLPAIMSQTGAVPFPTPIFALDRLPDISPVTIAIGALGGVFGWIIGYVLRNQDQRQAAPTTIEPAIAPALVQEAH